MSSQPVGAFAIAYALALGMAGTIGLKMVCAVWAGSRGRFWRTDWRFVADCVTEKGERLHHATSCSSSAIL
jgi:hypothetical protein